MNLSVCAKIKATVIFSGDFILAEFLGQTAENPLALPEKQLSFGIACI